VRRRLTKLKGEVAGSGGRVSLGTASQPPATRVNGLLTLPSQAGRAASHWTAARYGGDAMTGVSERGVPGSNAGSGAKKLTAWRAPQLEAVARAGASVAQRETGAGLRDDRPSIRQ
jgi:hypothetical protein